MNLLVFRSDLRTFELSGQLIIVSMKAHMAGRSSNCRRLSMVVLLLFAFTGAASGTRYIPSIAPQAKPPPRAMVLRSVPRGGASKNSVTKSSADAPLKKSSDGPILMLIRVLFLTYYGSLGSLMPYLPVYYHSLGHGGLMIGMLGAVKPLTTFLVAPIWGILSDRSTSRFRILYMTFLSSLVGQLLVAVSPEIHFLIGMVFLTAVMNAPVKSLIDSIVLDNLHDKTTYGKMRLWGQLGFGIGSWGVGQLLHRSNVGAAVPNLALPNMPVILSKITKAMYFFWMSLTGYRLLFLAYASLSLPTFLIMRYFEVLEKESSVSLTSNGKTSTVKTKEPAKIKEGLLLLLKNADAVLFFFLVFVVGVSSGVIENFAYVRMREVGGTGKEMGLSRLVSSAAGAPMFWFSGPLTNLLGADRVIVISLLNYVIRFFIYALMKNPYHGLPAEALRGVTFAAFWSTCTIYAHRISPPGMGATMLLLLNAMYGGLGQSVGAILGGKLQSKFGTVQTFMYAGFFDLAFVGMVMIYLYLKPNSSFKDPKPLGTATKKVL